MSKSKVLRFAPFRNARQIASTWRCWTQGDEFYLSSRNTTQLSKISFHRNLNWQCNLGTVLQKLRAPIHLRNGWIHGAQLKFLVDTGVLTPLTDGTGITALDTPIDTKCVVNISVQREVRKAVMNPPTEFAGEVLFHERLRSGNSVIISHETMPIDQNDRGIIDEVRAKLRVTTDANPGKGEVYAEAVWQQFDATGNVIIVVPVGSESVVRNVRVTASATTDEDEVGTPRVSV